MAEKEKENIEKKRIPIGALAALLSLVAAMIVVFIVYILNLRSSVLANASSYMTDIVSTSSNICKQYFNDRIGVLEHCSGELGDFTDAERIQERLSHYCTDHSFTRIAFVGTDGETITSDGKDLEASIRILALEAASSGVGSIYANSKTISNFDLYTGPVYGDDGKIHGAIIGGVVPLDLAEVVYKNDKDISSGYFIVDDNGTVMFAEKGAEMFYTGGSIVDKLEDSGNNVNELKAMLKQKDANGTVEVKLEEGDYLIAYSSIEGSSWTIILATPVQPVIEASRPLYVPSIIIIAALAGIFVFAALYMIKLTNDIRSYADEAVEDSRRMYYEDRITGYSSWYKFLNDYNRQVKDTSHKQAFISLDIDKFKATNDLIGYDGGNAVLKQLADIIAINIGKHDLFARISADKFFILAGYDKEDELRDLAERIITDAGYQITSVKIIVTMGIYPITDRSINAYTAADRADLARLRAKKSKTTYVFFDASMLENIRSEHFLETVMETALEKGEFLVYLQPKFGLDDANEVTGAEALVRWMHNGELVPPGKFIPIFERNGFVTKLDYYMFREVCRLQKSWLSRGFEPKIISVNMSRAHLSNPDFVSELSGFCKEFNIDPKYFEIEITESAAYENIDILMSVFTQIRDAGFHVSIDDFGTGYSSLNMLKDLPVDVLKIDRSFLTEDANEAENASKIIGCVVSLATSLNISTICEGIETKEQAALLTKLGCNMAQGFFFARPMPVAEYEKLVYHLNEEE